MPLGLCPNIAATGTCTESDCEYRHSTYACDLCGVLCRDASSLNQHNQGRQHKRNLAGGPRGAKRCLICDVVVDGNERVVQIHERGRRHQTGIKDYQEAGMPIPKMEDERPQNAVHCTLCNKEIPQSVWSRHLLTPGHKRKERFQRYKVALEESEKDKHGVVVAEERLDFGIVEMGTLRTQPTRVMPMHLTLEEEGTICLMEARMSSSVGSNAALRQVNFSARLSKPLHLKSGTTYLLQITFDPQGNIGHYDDRLELVFADSVTLHRFVIVRPIQAIVGVIADHEALKPTAPYVRPAPRPREPELQIVEGEQPPALARIVWKVVLLFADIPAYVWSALGQPSMADTLRRVQNTLLPSLLQPTTYAKHWKMLLWLDEIQATKDLQTYDMDNQSFPEIYNKYHYCTFTLEVPGLAEKRPSVIVGDKIIVRPVGRVSNNIGDGKWFEGYVHKVEKTRVALVFHPSFRAIRGQRFDVRFRLSRLPLRRMHQALETNCLEPRLLFPNPSIVETLRMRRPTVMETRVIQPFDKKIAENAPQWLAVCSIANLRPGAVPFVVFGPPGTGKTVTIIESMRQILHRSSTARILACAPSNSAADILAERLTSTLSRRELFRMNAASRSEDNLPLSLRDFSLTNEDGTFSIPPLRELVKFRVVVSTCLSASVPYGVGVPRGHFTHIFIDEAGQAMEPEAMIPVKTSAGPNTQVVLSGDPMQLGPIVRSPIAQKLGLGTSWLDRLMSLPAYEPTEYRGVTVVKLIKNWRSHPAILKFPNQEFYKGELEPHADEAITHSCLRWDMLPTNTFPMMFHAIKGKDERQSTSPSFFNIAEASAVREYVTNLKGHRQLRLMDPQIGVISPYNAQCQKIRSVIKMQHPGVKVGSVEEFQGQERRVIIISTVRSSMDYVTYDLRHTLGFVSNPRRFNVAITRAQALVIIVGDPDVLGLDPLWRSFLNYIHQNGGWKGRKIAWDPAEAVDRGVSGESDGPAAAGTSYGRQRRGEMETEMDELVGRVRAMVLSNVPVDEEDDEDPNGVERMEGNADRPWREVE
ncbi:hypothetical protein FRB96_008431 [Tulasnella sp. 330]|nr:hypothetical protein FRB96_008431 [Tulasnella sp. 330]